MNGWSAFWICVAVWVVCEAFITMQGIDTALWKFRTGPELELQKRLIEKNGGQT